MMSQRELEHHQDFGLFGFLPNMLKAQQSISKLKFCAFAVMHVVDDLRTNFYLSLVFDF